MRRVGWVGLVLMLAALGTAASASAQKRVALVIGNGTYTRVARLDNPKNDAVGMEAMFKAAAFTSVVRLEDLGVTAMKRALRDFSDTAQDADIAAVFYAGHGIEVAGVNYLIPIDAVLERDIDVQDEAVVAFSPDGKTVASGSTDTTVRFIDLDANAKGAPLTGHIGPVNAVRFSPDGLMLATAGSGGDERTVRLWNVGDRGVIGRLTGHLDSVTDVVFRPDGTMLATASADATVRLWRLSSRTQIASLRGHGGPVKAVAFSPDGKLLASAGADGTVRLWDVERRASIANLKARDEVNAVAFSPDGKLLASGGRENAVRLWNVDDRRAMGAIDIVSTTSGWVRSLAFSPDGRALAAGSVDNRIRIWDAAGGDLLVELTGHGNSVNDLSFHQGPGPELLLASAGDRTVRLWNLTGRLP